jgi:Peptidase family S41/Tricorn protease C1 domain
LIPHHQREEFEMPQCKRNLTGRITNLRRGTTRSCLNASESWCRLALLAVFGLLLLPAVQAYAQDLPNVTDFAQWQFISRTYRPPLSQTGASFFFQDSTRKAIGEQARSRNLTSDQKLRLFNSISFSLNNEWKTAIDQTWGPGLPTDQKLQIFDQFWQVIDQKFACFHHLAVDWHILRDTYRPEIAAGVSRGRFAAIMNQLSIRLQESHTRASDILVNYQTQLLPGTPIFYIGGWSRDNHFGAGLTPLSDKSLLVYNAVPSHPLGLKPGDIILGYGGIRWSDLYPGLLAAELPVAGSWWGSSPSAYEHSLLMSAGNNWHLFDTIDIRKQGTGEIVHLPTSKMAELGSSVFATEQLPVPGVPMLTSADVNIQKYVSWGTIRDTRIAYVYVMGWSGNTVADDLYQAVRSITGNPETRGLIIDFRTNYGGNMFLIDQTLPLLFKDRISTIGWGQRANDTDHYAMRDNPGGEPFYDIVGDPNTTFDLPIAMLVGPGAVSSGDQNALRMAFHPRAKLFGRSTAAAFNSPVTPSTLTGWSMRYAPSDAYLVSRRGHYLTHEELKVDFPVWLAPHDVSEGRDTVVAAAVAWINYQNAGYGSCEQTRWIPHVTPAGSGYTTRFAINNLGTDPAVIEIRPYDINGNALANQTAVIQGKGLRQFSADELFPKLAVSHFSICGPETSRVTAIYQVETGEGPSAPVNENSDSGTEFVFYPEEWSRIVDGVAIVNPNSESVKITASLVTQEGVDTETVTLAEDLKPYAKYISLVENFYPEYGGRTLKLKASRPVNLLMLRMNQDATILYPVSGLKQK